MAEMGFTGISFPFRVGVKGGVVTSTTDIRDVPHITEAMSQILATRKYERCMEYHIYSDIDTNIFDLEDNSTYTMISYQVKEALRKLEDRISVTRVDISAEENTIYATVYFTVGKYYDTTYNTKIKVGDRGANSN